MYNKGIERLDKEIDLVEMVKNFRKLDVIIKLLLKTDQQLLLDLKTTNYISSDEESEGYVLGHSKKKIIKKHKLLQRYIDNIKSKELNETDIKLLRILGFHSVIDLLTRPVGLEKINTEWIENPPLLIHGSSFKKKRSNKFDSNNSAGRKPQRHLATEKRVTFDHLADEEHKDPSSQHIFRSNKNIEKKKKMNKSSVDFSNQKLGLNIKQSEVFHKILKAKQHRSPYSLLNKKKWLYKNRSVDEKEFKRNRSDMRANPKKDSPEENDSQINITNIKNQVFIYKY